MQRQDSQTGSLQHVGVPLREWRARRRLTQHDLARAAGIPLRTLAALEAGRLLPTADLLMALTTRLEVPLRERNTLLTMAGYPPAYPMRRLDDPALDTARRTIELMLDRQAAHPVMLLDRHWTIVASNEPLRDLIASVEPGLLSSPVNWARLALHPAGLAPRIANLRAWRAHTLARLHQHQDSTGDPTLGRLHQELAAYPVPPAIARELELDSVAVPLRLMTVDGPLAFHGTTTTFDSALDVTLAELSIEILFPADSATATVMRRKQEVRDAAHAAAAD